MNNIKDIVKKDTLYMVENQRFLLYSKLEKITMAIYLITDIFPKDEPLKFHLRDKCLELLSFIMSLRRDNSKKGEAEILSLSSDISSLLSVSASVNLISEMNYKIIINEYNKFLKLVKGQSEDKLILRKDFFKDDGEITFDNKGQQKNTTDINVFNENIKDIIAKKRNNSIGHIRKKSGVFKKEKADRKELILKFIKDNKEVSIKDIAKVIKTWSEKTIQRDLLDMLKDGVLKKEGKRRWSKYSLK